MFACDKTYPISIALLSVVLTGGMTFGIFPKIRPLLESMHTNLPLPTRVLIVISDTIKQHWVTGIVLLSGIVLIGFIASKHHSIRTSIKKLNDRLLLSIPLLNTIIKNQTLSFFTGTLATLTSSGIAISTGLLRSQPHNSVYARAVERITTNIESGNTISGALAAYPKLFPDTMIQLISAAELSGSLVETLSFLSDYFQNEYEESIKKWSSLLEPVLMVLMGCAIGFIALAMILPIYALSQSVSSIH